MAFRFQQTTAGQVMENHFRANACLLWAGFSTGWFSRRNCFQLTDVGFKRKAEIRPYIDEADLMAFNEAMPVVSLSKAER